MSKSYQPPLPQGEPASCPYRFAVAPQKHSPVPQLDQAAARPGTVLGGMDETEGKIRDDPAIEGPGHGPLGVGGMAATPAAEALAATPTSSVSARDSGSPAARARESRRRRRRARRPGYWLPPGGPPASRRALPHPARPDAA